MTLEFFPKYTTVLDGNVYSAPVDVTGFTRIELEAHVATFSGTSITVEIQESNDLTTWTTVATQPIASGSISLPLVASRPMRFVRVVITAFTPSSAVMTFWVKGVARMIE